MRTKKKALTQAYIDHAMREFDTEFFSNPIHMLLGILVVAMAVCGASLVVAK